MSVLEKRLDQMKIYLAEAMLKPEENKLYIEDLQLSIATFEKQAEVHKPVLQNGWVDNTW